MLPFAGIFADNYGTLQTGLCEFSNYRRFVSKIYGQWQITF